ncbi:MAG: GTPase HflX, partial [Verrucomicrobia bacterium]|nr:GTPase HflX [Verrucomicrobiota bacterium]
MFDIKEKPKQVERALLVGVYKGAAQREESESLLNELSSLVDTLEIPVLGSLLVRVQEPNPRYFVGTGKAEEIFERARQV